MKVASCALLLLATAHGGFNPWHRAPTIGSKRPAITPATPVPVVGVARAPAFKVPGHLVLPAASYASLAGITAGSVMVMQASGMVAWQAALFLGGCIGLPTVLTIYPLLALGGRGIAEHMGGKPASAHMTSLAHEAAKAVGVRPPIVYEIPRSEPNAFAAGLGDGDSTVAVTTGLANILTDKEIKAVLAHEMGHLAHKDVARNMHVAVAAAGMGGIYSAGRWLLDSSRSPSKKKKDDDDKGSSASLGLMLMGAGLFSEMAAHGMRLAASRGAEYKADRAAAEAFGADSMISALTKIERAAAARPADLRTTPEGKKLAFAMISDGPSSKGLAHPNTPWYKAAFGKVVRATRTHPSTDDRVAALQKAVDNGLVQASDHFTW